MAELGKIERPDAEPYRAQRKLYLVPLVYSPQTPPADYVGLLARYWAGAREHIRRLEDRIGPVAKVFHESIGRGGIEGLKQIERLNPHSHEIIADKIAAGAALEALEDPELLAETVDWQRCLMLGQASQKVATQIWSSYRDANKRRYEYLAKRLDELLRPGEAGLLFIVEEHSIQFPAGLQVFYVAPPSLDEIHRWLRDHSREVEESAEAEAAEGQG